MKTVYHVYCEDYECEGMFSEDGKLLGMWSCNDGNWRDEYFNGFLRELDISIERGFHLEDALKAKAEEWWG